MLSHSGDNPGANLKSISHRCYLREVAFAWELTKDTIYSPLGCLQSGIRACEVRRPQPTPRDLISTAGPEANHATVLGLEPLLDVHEMTNALELQPFGCFRFPCQGMPLQGQSLRSTEKWRS